jgi:hypothetical protein
LFSAFGRHDDSALSTILTADARRHLPGPIHRSISRINQNMTAARIGSAAADLVRIAYALPSR